MIYSESTGSTEKIPTEVLSDMFYSLPSFKSTSLSEIEYCVFRLVYFLIPGSRMMAPISKIFSVFSKIQMVAISIFLTELILQNEKIQLPGYLTVLKVIYSFYAEQGTETSPIFFYFVTSISLVCLVLYIYSLILMHKRITISRGASAVLVLFTIDIPTILMIILANHVSKLFCLVILGKSQQYIAQFVILTIVFVMISAEYYFNTRTIINSQLYNSGRDASYLQGSGFIGIFVFMVCFMNFMAITLTSKNCAIVAFFVYAMFGVHILYSAFSLKFIHEGNNIFYASLGATLIGAAIIAIAQACGKIDYADIYSYVLSDFFIVCIMAFSLIFNARTKRTAKYLEEKSMEEHNLDFDTLNINSQYHFLLYVQKGFEYGIDFVLDGTFIEWGLKKYYSEDVVCFLLRYATLMPSTPRYTTFLLDKISKTPNCTLAQKFISFEFIHFQNLRATHGFTNEVAPIVSEIQRRVSKFAKIESIFASKACCQFGLNFLMLDSLATMRSLISHYIEFLSSEFPNNTNVMKLSADFALKVKNDPKECIKLLKRAASIDDENQHYADLTYLTPFDAFPISQMKIVSQQNGLARINTSESMTGSSKTANLNTLSQQGIHFSSQILKEMMNARVLIFRIISWLGVILLILSLLVMIFCGLFYANTVVDYGDRYRYLMTMYYQTTYDFMIALITPTKVLTLSETDPTYNMSEDVKMYWWILDRFRQDQYLLQDQLKSDTIGIGKYTRAFRLAADTQVMAATFQKGVYIQQEYVMHLDSFLSLTRALFTNVNVTSYADSPEDVNTMLNTLYDATNFTLNATKNYRNAGLQFIEQLQSDTMKTYMYCALPTVIIVILLFFLPLALYLEINKFTKLFPPTKYTRSVLAAYLSRDFTSFGCYVAQYIILLLLFVGLTAVQIFAYCTVAASMCSDNKDFTTTFLNDVNQLTYSMSGFRAFYLNLIVDTENATDTNIEKTGLRKYIDDSTNFFTNGTESEGTVVEYSRVNQSAYEFVMLALDLMDSDEIDSNVTQLLKMERILVGDSAIETQDACLFADVRALTEQVNTTTHNSISSTEAHNLYIVEAITLVTIILICIFINTFLKMLRALPEFIQLIENLPDSMAATTEKIVENLQNRSLFSSFTDFNRNTVIDLYNKPCVLTTKEGFITSVNRQWLTFFDSSPDDILGHNVSEYTAKEADSFMTIDVNESINLVSMDHVRAEEELRAEIAELEQEVMSLRSVSIPKRFVAMKEGKVELGFLVSAAIIISPSGGEDLNPDDCLADIQAVNNMIVERIASIKDVDFIRSSPHQMMLVFGCNELCSKEYLVLNALMVIIDVARWVVEMPWRSGQMIASCIITCGDKAEFVFSHDRVTTLEMFGDAFTKIMMLRENMEPNAVVVDKQTADIARSMKCGFEMDVINDEAYIFNLEQDSSAHEYDDLTAMGLSFR